MLTRGAVESVKVSCHVAPAAVALNGLALGKPKSAIPCATAQLNWTVPYAGCRKLKVKLVPAPVTLVAATPLIKRSDAFTPCTGSLNVTVAEVRLETMLPAAGLTVEIT